MCGPNDIKNFDTRNHPLPGQKQPTPKSGRIKGKFLKGPIPWSWLSRAALLQGTALSVGLCIWFLSGVTNQRKIKLSKKLVLEFGVSRSSYYRALKSLEKADLVSVERHLGRNMIVTLKE